MCQFSVQTDNFEFFGLNFGKLPNYMQYCGSNNVEGPAESWVEVEMSLVEVDGSGWSWVELDGGGRNWVEVDGAGWRWMELGGGGCMV